MPAKIPVTVLTGFLGAGKTTLLRHALAGAKGRRLAVIVNEFGDVGVDGALLEDGAEAVIELTNGCICCTVADDFLPALKTLLARDPAPEHIIIETSGLALPQPLLRALAWPDVRARVTVDGVVTVVDGAALAAGRFAHDEDHAGGGEADHETPVAELFEDQLSCADLIILNKTDLMSPADIRRAEDEIAHDARPGARMVKAAQGVVPVSILLGVGAEAENDADKRLSHHDHEGEEHDHDDFDSFIVDLPDAQDLESLRARVARAIEAHPVLRLKGFARVKDKPMRLTIQAVGPRLDTSFDRPWRLGDPAGARLVVIGETGLDRAAVAALLKGEAA